MTNGATNELINGEGGSGTRCCAHRREMMAMQREDQAIPVTSTQALSQRPSPGGQGLRLRSARR